MAEIEAEIDRLRGHVALGLALVRRGAATQIEATLILDLKAALDAFDREKACDDGDPDGRQ